MLHTLGWSRGGLLVLALVSALVGSAADSSPDALLAQARAAVAKQQWATAVTACDTLRAQSPDGAAIPEASVLLFQAYLGQNAQAKAEPLWKEILKRWPKTETAWAAADALYRYRAPQDAAGALAMLDDLCKQGLLPAGSEARARALHIDVMERVNPAEFCARALPLIQQAKSAKTLADLTEPAALARRVYAPLMAAKRFDDARQVTGLIQEQLALLGDTKGGMLADAVAYAQALGAADPARLQAELKPILGMLELAETVDEVALPVTVVGVAYAPLLKAGYRQEAQAMHTRVLAALQQLGNIGIWHLKDTQAYLESLAAVDTEAFVEQGLPVAQGVKDAKTAAEVQMQQAIARRLYAPLLTAKREPEVVQLHTAVQGALQRVGDPNGAHIGEMGDYLNALEGGAPARFLSEALVLLDAAKEVQRLPDLAIYESLALRVYPLLCKAERGNEAVALHATVRDTRWRLNGRWNTDYLYRYFLALQAHAPDRVLPEALDTFKLVKDIANDEEAKRWVDLAPRAYVALAKADRFAEARVLHGQLQRLFHAWEKGRPFADQEMLIYLPLLAAVEPDRYLDEALPVAQAITRVQTAADAAGPTQVARQLYRPLLTATREADAVALHAQVQGALATLKAPEEVLLAEMSDYLRALTDTNSPHLIAEVASVRTLMNRATTPPNALFPLSLANRLYLPLMQQKRPVEVEAVLRDATVLLKRVQAPVELHIAHSQAYFAALEATDPATFLTKALPVAQATLQGTTATEVAFGQDLAGRLYRPLAAATRAGEVKALHAQVLAALQRVGDPQQTRTTLAWNRYMEAVSLMPDAEVMADLTPFLTRLTKASQPEELTQVIALGQRLYLPLQKADRASDARALFTATQDALVRLRAPESGRAVNVGFYFDALKATNPDQFVAEAVPFVMGMTAVGGPTEAARIQYLTSQLYGPLMKAKRLRDAVALHTKVQALTAEAPYILPRHADSSAYLTALRATDPTAFLTEAQQELHASLQAATAPEHLGLALGLAHQVYESLMLAKRIEEHARLHAAIQQALAKFGDGQHKQALADRDDYGALLARIHPKQFVIEAQPVLERAYAVTRLTQWPLTEGYLQRYFTRLLADNEVERAQMTHRRLREALGRVEGGTPLARVVTHVYWAAAAQARPTELLADGITEIAAMTTPTTLADAQMPADLLALAYPLLQQAQRGGEAKALHETFQTALGKLEQSRLLQRADTVAYLQSLAGPQPQAFLASAQPLLAQAGESKTADDLRPLLDLARTTYATLMLQGRIDDAKTLHTQMQAVVAKAGNPEGLADADKLAYRNSLSQGAIDGMYALFKRAVAAGDVEGARKWLTNLNDVAPEHPKAIEARRLFKKMQ